MAIVRNNPLLKGISGSIGKQITFRQLGGQTVMSKYRGPSSVPPTDAQLSVRSQFAKAVAYARQAKKDQTLSSIYQAAASTAHSAYHLALRDALSAPSISQIKFNHSSDTITVAAEDIIRLHSVTVSIRNAEGILMEEGPASWKADTDEWIYKVSTIHSRQRGTVITALACDYPGNSTLFSVSLEGHISGGVKVKTAMRFNKQQTISVSTRPFLQPAFINYIEKKTREPDNTTKSSKHTYISQIKIRAAFGGQAEST